MESPFPDKSLEFASGGVWLYEELSKSKKDTTIAKQLLRSATSIGANLSFAGDRLPGRRRADFYTVLTVKNCKISTKNF